MTNVTPWSTSNTRIAYPFLEFSQSVSGLEELFADAYILSRDLDGQRVKLTYFKVLLAAGVWSAWARMTLEDGTALFDSDDALSSFKASEFGVWVVFEWSFGSSVVGSRGPSFVRLLIDSSKVDDYTYPLQPTDAIFVERAIDPGLQKVRRIFVTDPDDTSVEYELAGDIELVPGYNMAIQQRAQKEVGLGLSTTLLATSQSLLTRPKIEFGSEPGAGAGRFPDCSDPPLRSINGIEPNERGNVNIAAGPCYWAEIPGQNQDGKFVITQPNTLQLHGACGPCCRCEQYYAMYEQSRFLWAKLKTTIQRLTRADDIYRRLHVIYSSVCSQDGAADAGGAPFHIIYRWFPQSGWTAGLAVLFRNNTRFTGSGREMPTNATINLWHGFQMVLGSTPGIFVGGENESWRYFKSVAFTAFRFLSWKPRGEKIKVVRVPEDTPVTRNGIWPGMTFTEISPDPLPYDQIYFYKDTLYYSASYPLPPHEYEVLLLVFYVRDFLPDLYASLSPEVEGWREFVRSERADADPFAIFATVNEQGFADFGETDVVPTGFYGEGQLLLTVVGGELRQLHVARTPSDSTEMFPPLNRD